MKRRFSGFEMAVVFAAILSVIAALSNPASAQSPSVSIFTDEDSYVPGETIEVSLAGENPGLAVRVDVYVGLLTPDGAIYTLQPDGWTAGVGPWMMDIELPAGFGMVPVPLWWFEIPCDMPPIAETGQYSFASVLTAPGTLDWLCEASFAPFKVEPAVVQHYYVNAELGDDANDGSEQFPWRTITHALDSVEGSAATPVEIHVEAGIYAASTNGETFPLSMRSWVSLYGEGADLTVLHAEWTANVICRYYVDNWIIDGFTITGGEAYYGGGICCEGKIWREAGWVVSNNRIAGNSADRGGGIYCNGGRPMISDNIISDNSATMWGGGIHCSSSYPTIQDNLITGNSAQDGGGGICCWGASPRIHSNTISGNVCGGSWWLEQGGGGILCYCSSAVIQNNTVRDNISSEMGGGMCCSGDSSPVIRDNLIAGNSALGQSHGDRDGGGGIYCGSETFALIQGNRIAGNFAQSGGGGIGCWCSSASIEGNSITFNNARRGGGISCDFGSPTIADNLIFDNSTPDQGMGGGINCGDGSSAIIRSNLIKGNSASYGGGINSWSMIPTIENNTITDNSARMGDASGGGIFCGCASSPAIVNCIIWGNGDDVSQCSVSYCCIEDIEPGERNIHEDPMFVTGPLGEYYLHSDSPCVDAGDRLAEEAGFEDRTTQVDGTADTGQVDLGFHYPLPSQGSIQ